jgi:integrase
MQFLDETQASQFLLAVRGDRNETLYYLAIATGMRQSELLGLKWSDVDWEKRTMIVQRQAKRYNRDAGYFSPLKTRLGRRIIVLGEKTTNKLHEHLIQQATEIHQAGDKWNNLDLIFPSTSGTPQDQFNLYHSFKALLKQAGLPAVRFHDLRHTAASLMLNHGVPVLVVSRRLGHSKVSITLDIYGHLIPEMQNEAAEMIDEIINPVEIKLDDNLVSENIAQYTLANI